MRQVLTAVFAEVLPAWFKNRLTSKSMPERVSAVPDMDISNATHKQSTPARDATRRPRPRAHEIASNM